MAAGCDLRLGATTWASPCLSTPWATQPTTCEGELLLAKSCQSTSLAHCNVTLDRINFGLDTKHDCYGRNRKYPEYFASAQFCAENYKRESKGAAATAPGDKVIMPPGRIEVFDHHHHHHFVFQNNLIFVSFFPRPQPGGVWVDHGDRRSNPLVFFLFRFSPPMYTIVMVYHHYSMTYPADCDQQMAVEKSTVINSSRRRSESDHPTPPKIDK